MPKASRPTAPATPPRKPQQGRGLRRVEEILDAAENVIAEVGVQGASANMIAERAGSSVGSMYHFFPSKEAIVEALARRYATRKMQLNAEAIPIGRAEMPLEEIFERVVESHARFLAETPAFVPVYDAVVQGLSAGFMTADLREALVGQVREFLAARLPAMPEQDRNIAALVCVSTIHGVMLTSMRMRPNSRAPLHKELKRMMVAYFRPIEDTYRHRRS